MFREGGPFQYVILLQAIVFGVAPLIALIVAAVRLRAPAAIWIGIGVLPLFIGALGTYQGAAMALDAVAYASSEMKDKMGAHGLSAALYTLVFGGLVSGALLSMFAAALGLGTAIGPGPDARFSAAAAPGGLLLLASPLPAVFGLFTLVPMIALSAIGLMLVGLRFPSDPEGPDAPRVASARATVGVLGALAMFSGGTQSVSIAVSQAYFAMAMASPEMKDRMIASAMDTVGPAVALPVVYGLLLLLAGGVAAALAGKHLLRVRTLVSAALGALFLSAGLAGLHGVGLGVVAALCSDLAIASHLVGGGFQGG